MRSTGASIVEQAPPLLSATAGPAQTPEQLRAASSSLEQSAAPVQTGVGGPEPTPVQIHKVVSDKGFEKALQDMCEEKLAEVQRLCGEMLKSAEVTRGKTLEDLAQAQKQIHEDARLSASN